MLAPAVSANVGLLHGFNSTAGASEKRASLPTVGVPFRDRAGDMLFRIGALINRELRS